MAEKLDPKELVTFKELLTANSIRIDKKGRRNMKKTIISAIVAGSLMFGSGPAIAEWGWYDVEQARQAQQHEYEMERQQWLIEGQHQAEMERQRLDYENEMRIQREHDRIRIENEIEDEYEDQRIQRKRKAYDYNYEYEY